MSLVMAVTVMVVMAFVSVLSLLVIVCALVAKKTVGVRGAAMKNFVHDDIDEEACSSCDEHS